MKKIYIILLIVMLVSCASYTETHTNSLEYSEVRYQGYSEFDYIEIPEKTKIEVGPASPSFEFEEGRSFFVAVKVPDSLQKYVNITSRMIGQWIPTSHMFYPMTLFLDSEYKIIQKIPPTFVHNPRFFKGLDFDSQIAIPENAKYIVLHSIPEAFGKRIALFGKTPGGEQMTGVPTSGGMVFFVMSDPASSTAVGPTGTVWLEFSNEELALPDK